MRLRQLGRRHVTLALLGERRRVRAGIALLVLLGGLAFLLGRAL